ncbi:alanine racemase [Micropruina sonneratiae]|uniref:alanine racemase n=1 Tax=Micropruina sonneratiae TaxID=2986940 RepID=UPI0022277AD1|nr:alanine racemase [Micropruina sp. KQZ13P-5]MCW3159159.1 alanine racemase [Micropruina sp. KQZ13P-5]
MTYPTTATTLLDAVEANLRGVRARVGDRLVLAAVKADAYGHGAVAVASMIERTGAADWLGVATVGEGLELRGAGVRLPILKLSPVREDDDVEAALAADLTLSVVDDASADQVAAAMRRLGLSDVAVHLKVDTGMRRVGVEPEDAPALAGRIAASGLRLQGLFSHLPISDNPAGAAFTREQIERFAGTAAAVEDAVGPVELKHLANSGAVLGHPAAWFDLVRPGIMIYGSLPDPEAEPTVPLRPALQWRTAVTFVKRVEAGETVSYGRTWTAPRDTWIATIPVGYGDGYSRLLSNRGRVLIGGRSHPIAGRVCMDQTMVDLGPETSVRVGDEVVLVGRSGEEEITATELADLMGTIPYEVTCLITPRVTRDYLPALA